MGALVVSSILSGHCASSKKFETTATPVDKITLGVVVSLTGSFAGVGNDELRGAKVAEQQINALFRVNSTEEKNLASISFNLRKGAQRGFGAGKRIVRRKVKRIVLNLCAVGSGNIVQGLLHLGLSGEVQCRCVSKQLSSAELQERVLFQPLFAHRVVI